MPTVAASADMTTASSSTDDVTWRRAAPRARSSASSRLRWATRIVKVLTMMKPPTITAMIANTSRNVEITSRNWPTASWDSSATWSPVTASKPSGATVGGRGGQLAPG